MRQRPLFTVLCVAGTVASGVFLSGQQAPAPPRPTLVTLDKADAAKLAEAGRAAVQVEMPAGVELKLWAPDGLIADPVAVEIDARRHRLRRRHAAQQPAARHPRAPGLDDRSRTR